MSHPDHDPYLALTAEGALRAFSDRVPDEIGIALQYLVPMGASILRSEWLTINPEHAGILVIGIAQGWIHTIERQLPAPNVRLDNFLPHAIAGLSGSRTSALASDEGFCLARVGYSQDEAEMLCVAAADFFDFVSRQKQRGFRGTGRAVSFHESIDMLMPATTFVLFWVDDVGYWLILGGEPLINNRAFVELIWGIRVAGKKFSSVSEPSP